MADFVALGREHALVSGQVVAVDIHIADIVHTTQAEVHSLAGFGQEGERAPEPPAMLIDPLAGIGLPTIEQVGETTGPD
jgi:hypothetical protein